MREFKRNGKYIVALMLVFLLAFGTAITAFGADPVLISGNDPNASGLWNQYGYGCEDLIDFKINIQNPTGDFNDGVLFVTVSTPDKNTGLTWSSNIPVYYVFAKGGDNGNLYIYPNGATSDSGILAPLNPGGQRADISHVTFYYCESEEPEYGCLKITKLFEGYADDTELPESITVKISGDEEGLSYPVIGENVVINRTGEPGSYVWEWNRCDLITGDYTVVEVPISGWTPEMVPADGKVTVDAGEGAETALVTITNSFVDEPDPGCLKITKLFEGYADDTELPESITVKISGDEEGLSYPVTGENVVINRTGEPGKHVWVWERCDLITGEYTVVEVPISGWTPVMVPADGMVTVEAGEGAETALVTITNSFVDEPTFSISGFKYRNASGTTGIVNWNIYLYDGPKGEEGTKLVDSALTASDGSFRFDELDEGNYYLYEENRGGWTQLYPASGHHEIQIPAYANKEIVYEMTGYIFRNRTDDRPPNGGDTFGSIYFNKVLRGAGVTAADNARNFTVNVQGPNGYDRNVTFNVNNEGGLHNLEPGTYTFAEINVPEGFETVSVNPTSVTINRQTGPLTAWVTVTNAKDEEEENGGNGEIIVPPTPPFVPPVIVEEPEQEITITPVVPELPRTGGFETLLMGMGGLLAGAGAYIKIRNRKKRS